MSQTKIPLSKNTHVGPGEHLDIFIFFESYQGETPTQFDLEVSIGLHFPPGKYTITHKGRVILSHDYSTLVLSTQAEKLSSQILEEVFDDLKHKCGTKE